ncbi:MAG: hypothetical protein BBJ57_02380 [Desulfobacterales bacterium PC51MH44]|nr:MAG: hypothetical protein BBJ57_02380 [Desulfobacterales bacterium PC51MH44]
MKHSVQKLADEIGIHADTIWKARRRRQASFKLAEQLETITGIDRLWFIYPDKYGDGWQYIGENKEVNFGQSIK